MTDPAAGRESDGRRAALLVAIVLGAIGLVGLAARGDHSDRTAAAFGLPPSTATYLAMLLVVVSLIALALLVWATWGQDRAEPRPRKRSRWRDLIAGVVLLVIVFGGARVLRDHRPGRRPADQAAVAPPPKPGAHDSHRVPRASGAASVALAALAIGALGLSAAASARRARRERHSGLVDMGEPDLIASADRAMSSLTSPDQARLVARGDPDPRRAVRAAYRAAELVLGPTALARRAPVAPREWVAAVRATAFGDPASAPAGVIADALARLVARYEIARFSDHTVDEDDRRDALDALDRVFDAAALLTTSATTTSSSSPLTTPAESA